MKLLAKILCVLFIVMCISCKTKTDAYSFVKEFSKVLITKDSKELAKMINFPVINGEYLIGKELNEENFINYFDEVFNQKAINRFVNLKEEEMIYDEDLKNILKISKYSKLFYIAVDYNSVDTETTVYYIFGQINDSIQLIAINMAG